MELLQLRLLMLKKLLGQMEDLLCFLTGLPSAH